MSASTTNFKKKNTRFKYPESNLQDIKSNLNNKQSNLNNKQSNLKTGKSNLSAFVIFIVSFSFFFSGSFFSGQGMKRAEAFFGDPCLVSYYSLLVCYGVNPGTVRTDSGLENVQNALSFHDLGQKIGMLKGLDMKGFFQTPDALEIKRDAAPPVFEREKAGEANKYSPIPEPEKGLDFNISDLHFQYASESGKSQAMKKLSYDFASTEAVLLANLSARAEELATEALGVQRAERKDVPMEDFIRPILEKLGLTSDALAVVRIIAGNMAKLNEEAKRTEELEFALAEMEKMETIIAGRLTFYAGRLYALDIQSTLTPWSVVNYVVR